jgi:hypothetical protein
VVRTRLDDLYALARNRFAPVLPLSFGEELLQDRELTRPGLRHLADQVFGQSSVVARYCQHRQDVAGFYRANRSG